MAATHIIFKNDSLMSVTVYWLAAGHDEKKYSTLAPGQQYDQSTYVGHKWIVRAGSDVRGSIVWQGAGTAATLTATIPPTSEVKSTAGMNEAKQNARHNNCAVHQPNKPVAQFKTVIRWYNHSATTTFDVYWQRSSTAGDERHTGILIPNGGALGQNTYNDHRWIIKLKDVPESCIWTGVSALGTLNVTVRDTPMAGIYDVTSVEESAADAVPAVAAVADAIPVAAVAATPVVTTPPIAAASASTPLAVPTTIATTGGMIEVKLSGRHQISDSLRDCADNISTKLYHRHIISITHPTSGVVYPFTFNIEQGVERNHRQLFATLREDAKFVVDHITPDILAIITKIPFWINESFHYGSLTGKVQVGRGMCHHPSDVWLYQNGNDPIKQHSVEIYSTDDYLSWRQSQPQMFLHELTHAYHAHLGGGTVVRPIIDAYNHAMEHKLYDSVDYVCSPGTKQRAYAATNVSEYFAELTEAYFGRNDYFPFTRDELRKHDIVGFNMVQRLWTYTAKEIAAIAAPPRPSLVI